MLLKKKCFLFLTWILGVLGEKDKEIRNFPDTLKFGAATASYQIEGGWNASDKGENIWDRLTHTTNFVVDGSTGDVACDSYNQAKRDVEMLQELGVAFYRFSISWSRLLPDGFANKVSDDGSRYYNELINDLLAANITPFITLYHWDLPQPLQDLGGWANPLIVQYAADYANIAFELFGDRVKNWITINEPWVICLNGYGGQIDAPSLGMSGIADYLCAHNIIKAHAEIYHLYDEVYRPIQEGRIGWTLNINWNEPETESPADLAATEKSMQFNVGLLIQYTHPQGDYPQVMKDVIAEKSAQQGYPRSRLPEFTAQEIEYVKETSDFFGLNHYTTYIIKSPEVRTDTRISFWEDLDVISYQDSSWPSSSTSWLKVVPWGFTKLLNWIKNTYNNPEIIIFENGFADRDGTDDVDRIAYYNGYLNAMLDAIEDGCNVTSYAAWSLMDNFEWTQGYTQRFGLYYVDFNNPSRPRIPKSSALYYKDIIATKTIEQNSIISRNINLDFKNMN